MNFIPPSFEFNGDKVNGLSLKGQALSFYNFVSRQADKEGLPFVIKKKTLSNGSTITVTAKKESQHNNIVGKIVITSPQITPSKVVKKIDFYATNIVKDDIDNRELWTSLQSKDLKLDFKGGQAYWIENKHNLKPKENAVCLSWRNGILYHGGLESNSIGIGAACYNRDLDRIVVANGTQLILYYYQRTGKTTFNLSIDRIFSLPTLSFTNRRILGFLDDCTTLFVETYDNALKNTQRIYRIRFSPDYSSSNNSILWEGGRSTVGYEYKTFSKAIPPNKYDAALNGLHIINSTYDVSFTKKEYFSDFFIYKDVLTVIFYEPTDYSYLRETTSDSLSQYVVVPQPLFYESTQSGITDVMANDKYTVRACTSTSGFIDMNTYIGVRTVTGNSSNYYREDWTYEPMPIGNYTQTESETLNHSFTYEIPIYCNPLENIYITFSVSNSFSVIRSKNISGVIGDIPTVITNETLNSTVNSHIKFNGNIIDSKTETTTTPNTINTIGAGQLGFTFDTNFIFNRIEGDYSVFRRPPLSILGIATSLGEPDPYLTVTGDASTNSTYAFDEKILLLPYTLRNVLSSDTFSYKTLASNSLGTILTILDNRLDSRESGINNIPITVSSEDYTFDH